MEFEFDPTKSEVNRCKHGIDFEEAAALWDDPDLLIAPARSDDEPRRMAIGAIGGVIWAAIVTPRGDRLRLISVRRARAEEVKRYEGD